MRATNQGLPELGLDVAYERDGTTSKHDFGGVSIKSHLSVSPLNITTVATIRIASVLVEVIAN